MRLRLQSVRERLFVTQEELSERTGMSRATISRLENHRQRPRISTVRKLAEALGVQPEALFPHGASDVIGVLPRPAKTPTKPERETWQAWWSETIDPSELLTREEVLSQLEQDGVIVSTEDLRNWQRIGAIPFAVRRWHDGAVRALYHPGMPTVIRMLRDLQAHGEKMAEIRATLRATFRDKTLPFIISPPVAEAAGGTLAPTLTVRKPSKGSGHGHINGAAQKHGRWLGPDGPTSLDRIEPVSVEKRVEIPAELKRHVAGFARTSEQALGGRIVRAQVQLIDERGLPLVFEFDVAPEPNE